MSFSYFFNRSLGSRLTSTVISLVTFIILEANLRVEMVYSRWAASGQILAIMQVLELPPIESLRR